MRDSRRSSPMDDLAAVAVLSTLENVRSASAVVMENCQNAQHAACRCLAAEPHEVNSFPELIIINVKNFHRSLTTVVRAQNDTTKTLV